MYVLAFFTVAQVAKKNISATWVTIGLKVNGLYKGVTATPKYLACFQSSARSENTVKQHLQLLILVSAINYSNNNFTINKIDRQVPLHLISTNQ